MKHPLFLTELRQWASVRVLAAITLLLYGSTFYFILPVESAALDRAALDAEFTTP